MIRIAVVDDDPALRAQIGMALAGLNYDITEFSDGSQLIAGLKRDTYDVVLLDWNMPRTDGPQVLEWAHGAMPHPPAFVMLTSRNSKDDILRALGLGAGDFIVKPEDTDIIRARIEAVTRRSLAHLEEPVATFGRYVIDRRRDTITCDGEEVKLTLKEFALAAVMFDHLNKPLSRSFLLTAVWGSNEDVETRTLDMHVSRIRSKLNLRPENGFSIQTVYGFGYRMSNFVGN